MKNTDKSNGKVWAQLSKDVSLASERASIRFAATLDSKKYRQFGFVFSLSDEMPVIGGENCTVSKVAAAHRSIPANEGKIKAKELGGTYAYTMRLKNIPHTHFATPIYMRAYVLTRQELYIYSETYCYTVEQLLEGTDVKQGGEACCLRGSENKDEEL